MKKQFFTILLLVASLIVFGQTYNVIVSGTVEDIETGEPIEGQIVFINTDSISGDFFYYNMVFTNDNGYFEDTFDVPTGLSGDIYISTPGCEGEMLEEVVQFSENNNNFTFSFLSCGDPTGGGDCQAMFYYYPYDNSMYTLQFVDESFGNPDNWSWDFGEGNTSTEQNPIHTFDELGEYLVSLTISSDSMGCESTIEMPVYVGDSIWFPDSCMAMFFSCPDSSDFMTMHFADMSIGIDGNAPDSWSWDFGDGNSSSEQNPVHTYEDEGEYEVCLTIASDDGNCTNTFCSLVYVSDWNEDCMAMYYAYPEEEDFFTFYFMDMSFANGNNPPDNWSWSFGDGTGSEEQNPVHTFASEGVYEVCLTISTDDGECESTWCEYIEVLDWNEYCQADFFYYPANDSFPVNGDYSMQFIDISYGNPTSWDWDFGDGATSTEQNPIHTYEEDGFYNVCLSISNPEDSCESTMCQEVYVFNDTIWDCWAWFEYEINDLTVDFEAFLNNSQTGDYTWDFGDGETGNGPNISHTYADDGIYIVALSVVDSATGCYSTYIDYLWVGDNITFSIAGNIYLQDSAYADDGTVYLMTFDTIGNGLINVAETEITADGYYEFEEVGIENCIYFVQAELSENSAYYGDYLPTYHYSALNWMEAMPVFPFFFDYPADVYMIAAEDNTSTGDGMISGTVSNEEGRSLLQDVEILLFDENNNPLTYIMTNDDGIFDFAELSFGTYIVYTEIVGIETNPVTVILNADNPTANINIIVRNGEAVLGIENPQSEIIGEVGLAFPNPTSDNVSIVVNMKQNANVNISISNNYGQQLMNEDKQLGTGVQQIKLKTNTLPKGLYFISIKTDDGVVQVQKLVKL